MARRTIRSISVPIVLAVITVALSIALLVGWMLLVVQNTSLTREVTGNAWLLVLGAIAFAVIVTGQVMFSIFLVREILEVRRQDSFIDSVTHELKSPLASLRLCLETLGRSQLDQGQREDLRQMMLNDVDRLTDFIDDVLQSSRLTHGRVGLSVSAVPLHALVSRCAAMVTSRQKMPEGAIVNEIDADLVVHTDRPGLELVIKNLLDNSVKYSLDPVSVRLRSRVAPEGVVIEVSDAGIGIPKRHLKRIFQRFYRVPSPNVRTRRGTGLGLFVVSSMVRNLGGKIRASSPGPGRGATMHVFLPGPIERLPPGGHPAPPPLSPAPEASDLGAV